MLKREEEGVEMDALMDTSVMTVLKNLSWCRQIEMYLFQEVGKPELGFPNQELIQLWTGRVPVGHESFQ